MSLNLHIGRKGEAIAAKTLTAKGYKILETNFKTRFCELDIIAKLDNTICFVEVKTRTSTQKGLPREAVNLKKQQKIITGAQYYIKMQKLRSSRIRFDVIEVLIQQDKSKTMQLNHIENAFGSR